MAENVEYIDRNKLMAEMQKVRQDLYDGNASPEVVLWWSMAIRIVKLSAAVKAVEKDDARKVEWIPVTPETMPPEDENGESEHLILSANFMGWKTGSVLWFYKNRKMAYSHVCRTDGRR